MEGRKWNNLITVLIFEMFLLHKSNNPISHDSITSENIFQLILLEELSHQKYL